MKLETITFADQPVGLRIVAETARDRVLLDALSHLPAEPDSGQGVGPVGRLTLSPRLPWDNLEER